MDKEQALNTFLDFAARSGIEMNFLREDSRMAIHRVYESTFRPPLVLRLNADILDAHLARMIGKSPQETDSTDIVDNISLLVTHLQETAQTRCGKGSHLGLAGQSVVVEHRDTWA
ncbi:hypothetical protein AB0I72_07075 [Nocardiopsis sp. NPDC049922]|uniref:hypothetical protein n=1 Tax=Nocardiopsis sp. NPDC049922 TaxID=3155157 RepID=UPI003411D3A8